jgi:hypothetical protein
MKIMQFSMLLSALVASGSPVAFGYDIFFKGEGHRFVKTEVVQVESKPYVLFSSCEVSAPELAWCVDRILVSQEKMLNGTGGEIAAGYVGGGLFTGLSVGMSGLILAISGGNPLAANALGFGLFGMSVMGSAGSVSLLVDTYRFQQVVSDQNAYDLDHSVRWVSYEDFIKRLVSSTSNETKRGEIFSLLEHSLKPQRNEPYANSLSPEQIQWLRHMVQ